MATETLNHFTLLAEQHADLQEQGEIHKAAGCRIPKLNSRTLNLLESNAEVAIADIAAGMQGLAHLITNYPSDVGMESTVMPQIGRLLRVLGEALEHTHDAAHMIADRQWAHGRIEAAEGKPC
ncbi:hypothetical protein [Aquitalea denitrificans]|uniref:hypothetical protein n=1 Tax=Aquitalea denitrificans TaxID=519081 RepID=UPI00135AF252|nr:hypothetical protein [Aquitalea denitrificans]